MAAQFVALTEKGRRKPTNQDAVAVRDLGYGWTVLVVADGVGGQRGGETASQEAVQSIVSDLVYLGVPDPAGSLRRAVTVANRRVRDLAADQQQLAGMATTVVIALVKGKKAWIASVGDSRAYLCDGVTSRVLTEDDSWVAEQLRAGQITAEEAAVSPYQNVITKGIGVEDGLTVERIVEACVGGGEALLLCSDGLYRTMPPDAFSIAATADDLDRAAQELVDRANAAGGPDNISVIVFRMGDGSAG
ncbi:MAG: protein phosphatase 2C domain-containing protein [Dehalococcoidia bacterium]